MCNQKCLRLSGDIVPDPKLSSGTQRQRTNHIALETMSLSGQSGHLDCFVQLLNKIDNEVENDKVVVNKENDRTDLTAQPNDDYGDEKLSPREALRVAMSLRHSFRNGFVAQPLPNDLSIWMVGKEVRGTTRWLDQTGTKEWALSEVRRRSIQKAFN